MQTQIAAKPLSAKADRSVFGLKVRLRLKPPEESPADCRLKSPGGAKEIFLRPFGAPFAFLVTGGSHKALAPG
jgi:hypothetical protein